jgi:hypothetical protein
MVGAVISYTLTARVAGGTQQGMGGDPAAVTVRPRRSLIWCTGRRD